MDYSISDLVTGLDFRPRFFTRLFPFLRSDGENYGIQSTVPAIPPTSLTITVSPLPSGRITKMPIAAIAGQPLPVGGDGRIQSRCLDVGELGRHSA